MAWELTSACANVTIEDRRDAVVKVTPKRKKVAIVGFATNTLHLVPWNDPTFELWGLNQGHMHMLRRGDRHFEMHQPEYVEDARDPQYMAFLRSCQIPVYMIDVRADIPSSVRFPIEHAITLAGRDYFTSSIAYMIALALIEGMEEIHLYGINLAIGEEYTWEKPCAEWWLGMAKGMGVKVYIPQASSLLKQYARYGYAPEARPNALTRALLNARIQHYRSQCEAKLGEYNTFIGAMREAEALIQAIEGQEHGADIVMIPASNPGAQSTTTISTST